MPAIRVRMAPHFFWGGALVPAFFPRSTRAGRFTGDNHSGMREIEECGCVTPVPRFMLPPPVTPVTKTMRSFVTRKPTVLGPLSADLIPGRKPDRPPCREVVNRDHGGGHVDRSVCFVCRPHGRRRSFFLGGRQVYHHPKSNTIPSHRVILGLWPPELSTNGADDVVATQNRISSMAAWTTLGVRFGAAQSLIERVSNRFSRGCHQKSPCLRVA